MSIRQLREAAEATIHDVRAATDVAAHTAALLHELGDEAGAEAAHRLVHALPRAPATVVLAGEFKSGKSSLANAMLGGRVVPADPLSSTSVPVRIAHGDELRLAVRVRTAASGPDDGAEDRAPGAVLVEEVVDADTYADLLDAPAAEWRGLPVDHVDVRLPNPLVELGLQVVDTPSISGGITSPMAGTVLAEAAAADVVVFTTDASQELTAPEVEFLRLAASLGTRVVVAMTKTDVAPAWRALLDRNHDHLAAAFGGAPPIFPVSPALRRAAVRYGDGQLDVESGVPLLLWYLVATVLTEARQRAVVEAGDALQRRLADAEDSVAASRRALASAKERRLVQAQLEAAAERATRLDRQWQGRLRLELDRFQLEVDADLNDELQAVSRLVAQTIDAHDPNSEWAVIEGRFTEALNRATARHLRFLRERASVVYEAMEGFLGVPAGTLAAGPLEVPEHHIPVELDRPDLAVDSSSQLVLAGGNVSRFAWLAGSALGGPLALFGGLSVALTGGAVGLGVAGAGALFWRGRARAAALDEARRRVRAQAHVDLGEAARAATLASRSARAELQARLQEDIVRQVAALTAQLRQEVEQLARIAGVADEHRPAKDRELEELLDRIRLVRGHAARLRHRAERPLVAVPSR